jgi:hypothetical protein
MMAAGFPQRDAQLLQFLACPVLPYRAVFIFDARLKNIEDIGPIQSLNGPVSPFCDSPLLP